MSSILGQGKTGQGLSLSIAIGYLARTAEKANMCSQQQPDTSYAHAQAVAAIYGVTISNHIERRAWLIFRRPMLFKLNNCDNPWVTFAYFVQAKSQETVLLATEHSEGPADNPSDSSSVNGRGLGSETESRWQKAPKVGDKKATN